MILCGEGKCKKENSKFKTQNSKPQLKTKSFKRDLINFELRDIMGFVIEGIQDTKILNTIY